MTHLDEGTLQALLDGELPPRDAAGAEAHLASCAACAELLAELRALGERQSALLGMMDVQPPPLRLPSAPAARPGVRRYVLAPGVLARAAVVLLALAVAGVTVPGSPLRIRGKSDGGGSIAATSVRAAPRTAVPVQEQVASAAAADSPVYYARRMEVTDAEPAPPAPAVVLPAVSADAEVSRPTARAPVPPPPPPPPAAAVDVAEEFNAKVDEGISLRRAPRSTNASPLLLEDVVVTGVAARDSVACAAERTARARMAPVADSAGRDSVDVAPVDSINGRTACP